ncbi:MAG: class B sortase [Lachnospiraceae bacterium]|nr:class B sortase [Lachnospiraceae bacterium]
MRKKKLILKCLTVFFVLLFCVSGFIMAKEYIERQMDADNFDELSHLAHMNTSGAAETHNAVIVEGTDLTVQEPKEHERNLVFLQQENDECVGWLYIEDTRVNYPVMHTPDNPEKYLRLNFYGEYSVSGVPFMDGACRITDMHIIIYGHNMRNDTMFGDVSEYAKRDFRDEHPFIEFETANGVSQYEVFAVAVVDATDDWYFTNPADTEESYAEKIAYINAIKLYETGITPEYGEKLLTLSTCYGNEEDARLIVVAVERS